MEIVSVIAQVAQPIMDYTVAPVARQVGYLLFYNTNFKNLQVQVAELKGVKDTINQEVEAERRKGRQIYDHVRSWLNKMDQIVEEAEKLSDDPRRRNASCCKGPFPPNLMSRHQLSRKAKKLAASVAKVIQGKQRINALTFLPNLEVVPTSATSSEKLESRKKLKQDIVSALIDRNISRIGVYGLGGVGKTTLVKEIAKQVKDDKLFDEVVTANISQAADLERIQGEIADLLGLRFEETTVAGRALRLKQRIKSEKSILIILDDIWSILELEKLGIPQKDHQGCKLLLTSRNQEILQKMETQEDFLVDVLKEEEAWSLFEDMVGDAVKDVSLHDVAFQVAQKCAGLIVLVVTVARALKNQDNIDSWNDALNQLKTVDKEGMNGIIYSALELSYNHLEGDDVKALFLLCGLHGQQISVEDLLKYSVGLGIFKQIHTQKDARLKLHRSIDLLKASCLLIESNSNRFVKMHDIVHEVALSIASRDQHVCKIGRGNEMWPKEEFLQRCTQINIEGCHIRELIGRLECPNIEFFHLHNENESLSVPDSFFEGMKNLKVLHLTCMHLPSLPQSFHSLIDLQTICLHQCVLGDMTNIGALMNLQILSLYGSSMIRLPSELRQLTHLRMLDLSKSGIEIFPSNIISKLTNLEELHMGNASIKWDQEDSIEENKNASLTELRHLTNLTALEIQINGAWLLPRNIMFNKLERYKIVIGDVWEWSDNYEASKTLKLKIGTVIHLEHVIKELIKGVEVLYLDEVNGISNVLYDLNGEGFPLIRHLHIQNNGKIQHIINTMQREPSNVFFPRLETLVLQNLNNLEEICHGSFVNSSFAKLRSIKVKCCDQLKYLFSALMVKALSQLIEIDVSECSSMKMIVSVEYSFQNSVAVDDDIEICSLRSLTLRSLPAIEDFYSGLSTSSTTTKQSSSSHTHVPSSFFYAKVKFFNLETLKLSSIRLENIWQDDQLSVGNSFHKLAKLCVKECSNLKYLFSCSTVGSFPNLKELEIRECEMMEEIIGTKGRNGSILEEVGLSKLESVLISNMKKLKKVWHSQFDGLKKMEVNSCERLENIFAFDAMHTTFGRMETLKVSDCGSVKEIFQLPANEEDTITHVTQLKKLLLLDLPKLKQIWSKDPQGAFCFHNLQDVLVESCENLECLFPFSIAMDLHQLQNLEVKFCGMNEIVAKKEGPMDENPIFHFDRLDYLLMWDLQQLDRFYGGSHSLSCPLLRVSWVFHCPKLKLLGRQSTSHHHRKSFDHKNSHLSSQQPLFIIEEVIPKLEEWTINNEEALMVLQDPQWRDHYFGKLKLLRLSRFEDVAAVTFLDSIVQKAPNLKSLVVENGSLEEIFQDKRIVDTEGENKINTQLEFLRLLNQGLQHICREGFKIDPILEVLEDLYVADCGNLKTLVPSSVTFSHLTDLEIEKCNGLINLIYSSTATSLVNLKAITLKECNSLEEIVTHGTNETRDGIAFRNLRILALVNLPRLKSFSSSQCFFRFPLLNEVVVSECPRMRTFCERATSTTMLRKVLIKEGKDEEWCWEGDLNGTIKKVHEITLHNSERLNFSWYPELRDSWSRLVENKIFCKLKSLVVEQCDFLSEVLIPSNLLPALENLEEIQVKDCDSLEVVFEFATATEEATSKNEACRLREIHLSNLPKLQYIWKPSFGGQRENDQLQIQHQHQEPQSFIAKVLLPNLETIIIKELPKLKTIWHPFTSNSIGSSLKTMEVSKCKKLDNIFPSYMERAFIGLETLIVNNCNSVQVIFEFSSQMGNAEDTTRLQKLTLLWLSKLKQIWSRDPQENLPFHKLLHVRVENCNNLEYLFPLSIAMHAVHLADITIKNAERMKQIVSAEEGTLDDPVKFEFNHLTSLVLWSLEEMEGFFAGNHNLLCPLLRELDIRACAKVKLFKTQCWSSQGRVSMQQPLFTLEEVIGKLEKLALDSEHADIILQRQLSSEDFVKLKSICLRDLTDDQAGLPYWFLQKLTSLEGLVVGHSYFKEVFHKVILASEEGKFEIRSRIKKLSLSHLPELHHICKEEFQMNPIIEALKKLWVKYCPNMKHLVPSSVTFCQLTYLEVQNCNGLIDLVTSSTARSLVRLTTLNIRDCNSLTQVVATEREEAEDQINFGSLRNLELQRLPKIKRFCSSKCLLNFPLLENVVVKQCPRMNNFTMGGARTPKLSKIRSNEEDEQLHWDGDLNMTINKMFVDMVAFHSFNHLEFSEYPEMKELWYGQVGQKIFCNLKHMVVRKCAFLSTMIFSSNLLQVLHALEVLEVAECDSLEAIFDVKALDDKAMESKEVSGLKKLTLSGLPNLKHIWNKEAEEIISFGNLQILEVEQCQHLKNLFSVSLCHDLRQLEQLCIESCGVEEIVSVEEGSEKLKFDFPQLTSLMLFNLTQLTNFYPKRYTLECPSLETLNVHGCEELQVFAFDDLDSQPLSREDNTELQTKKAMFHIEKVSQNLEDMSLNENDTMKILNGKCDKKLFESIKILRLQHFQKTPIKFLNDLIKKFPATTTLGLRHSSFEILFPQKEIGHYSIESSTQIKNLWLLQLDQLEHIWKDDDLASHTLIQNLEDLSIVECSGIITLVPTSASFKSLTSLAVVDCNGLMFFMTSCTAKSLVHLTSLTISNCVMLEEVVMTDEGESEEEITFESLMYLELTGLSSFKSFCPAKHTFTFLSLVTLKVTGCPKMQNFSSEVIIAPFLKSVEVENGKKRWKEDLNTTIKQLFIDKAIGKSVDGDYKESSSTHEQNSQTHQKRLSTSRALSFLEEAESQADEIVDSRKQEMHKLPIPHTGIGTQKICEIVETPPNQTGQNTSSLTKVDAALGTQDETIERPLVQAFHQDAKNREMHETIQRPLVQNVEDMLIPASIQDTGTRIHAAHGSIEIPFIQATQNTSDITIEQKKAPFQASKVTSSSTTTPLENGVLATGTQDIHAIMDKPLIQTDQDAEKLARAQNTEESRDSFIKNQEISDTIEKPTIPATQNLVNSTMITEAALDPSASEAQEPMIPSVQESNIYRNYKGMVDIPGQNMPYLEAGLKRHPQVLDWLNTKRPRVLASSFFSLFSEVTRILRTTRRVNLTEDYRNYIKECCAALQGVGFDESWISYVHGCIEECAGDEEDLERKVEETEAQIESMKKEVASLEESLVLLRHKASRLHNFIES